jgi:type II secretory pathway pseudopilin PulG
MKRFRAESGFSYLVLLFTVAIAGAGLAGAGTVWHTAQQRERETELLYIGNQYRNAIASYYARTPANQPRYPASLDHLLKDPRYPATVRHLRKPYRDPITGTDDWGLILAPGGGIMGVFSKSEAAPIKRAEFDALNRPLEDRAKQLGDKMTYKDWHFVYVGPVAIPGPGQPAPKGPLARRPRPGQGGN